MTKNLWQVAIGTEMEVVPTDAVMAVEQQTIIHWKKKKKREGCIEICFHIADEYLTYNDL